MVARRAHNPKVAGSSPALATLKIRNSLFDMKLRIFFFSNGNILATNLKFYGVKSKSKTSQALLTQTKGHGI